MTTPATKAVEANYKLVVLGAGGVGKSALLLYFTTGAFVKNHDPTLEDVYTKAIEVDNKNYKLEILEPGPTKEKTAGRELQLRISDGFLILYSVANDTGLQDVEELRNDIIAAKGQDLFPMVLVGTKVDLQDDRKVTVEQGESLARKYGCPFMETSAMTGININEVFATIVRQINLMRPEGTESKSDQSRCVVM